MHRVQNAKNNHWDNRIEQKFGSGWWDWRALLRTLFDWHRPLRSFWAQIRMVVLSVREKGARACPALPCTSFIVRPIFVSSGWGKKARLIPLAIIPIACVQVAQVSLSLQKKSGRESDLSPWFFLTRGGRLYTSYHSKGPCYLKYFKVFSLFWGY